MSALAQWSWAHPYLVVVVLVCYFAVLVAAIRGMR